MTGRLTGRRAIVTGGARGIGAGIASALAAEGARVAVIDRLEAEGRAVADRLGGEFVPADLADPVGTRVATASAVAALAGVDVLVNCAGLFQRRALLDIATDDWDRLFAVNVRAMLITMQVCAPHMIAAGGGRIVNIASMAAKQGGAMEAHYAATKAAVVALTRAAAQEWGAHGVLANSVCPGFVLTEMGAGTRTPEQIAAWSSRSPLGRLAEVDDVAAVVRFLVLPDSAYMTGQAVNVTGGMITH